MKGYGELRLTENQSFIEFLTRDQLRIWLGIDMAGESDDAQDTLLDSLIVAARTIAEEIQGVDLVGKQWDYHLDLFPNDVQDPVIELRYPLNTVDIFRYTDSKGVVTTLVENTHYVVDKARGVLTPPWGQIWPIFAPQPSSAIFIRFKSGYCVSDPFWKDVGQHVIQGMRLLITGWHEGRYPFGRQVLEFPYGPTALLRYGARPRAI